MLHERIRLAQPADRIVSGSSSPSPSFMHLLAPHAIDAPAPAPMQLHATLTCPHCRAAERLSMPANACVYFHTCGACGRRLKPQPGDCCVFCSYADVPCPPVQTNGTCCSDALSEP